MGGVGRAWSVSASCQTPGSESHIANANELERRQQRHRGTANEADGEDTSV